MSHRGAIAIEKTDMKGKINHRMGEHRNKN